MADDYRYVAIPLDPENPDETETLAFPKSMSDREVEEAIWRRNPKLAPKEAQPGLITKTFKAAYSISVPGIIQRIGDKPGYERTQADITELGATTRRGGYEALSSLATGMGAGIDYLQNSPLRVMASADLSKVPDLDKKLEGKSPKEGLKIIAEESEKLEQEWFDKEKKRREESPGPVDFLREGLLETGKVYGERAEAIPLASIAEASFVEDPSLIFNPRYLEHQIARQSPNLAMTVAAGGGVGSAAKFLGAADKVAKGLAIVSGATAGALMEGSQVYEEALEKGMSERDALDAFAKQALISSALEATSLSFIFKKLPDGIKKQLAHRLLAGGVEAGTEFMQEAIGAGLVGESTGAAVNRGLETIPASFIMGIMFAGAAPQFEQTQTQSDLKRTFEALPGRVERPALPGPEEVQRLALPTPEDATEPTVPEIERPERYRAGMSDEELGTPISTRPDTATIPGSTRHAPVPMTGTSKRHLQRAMRNEPAEQKGLIRLYSVDGVRFYPDWESASAGLQEAPKAIQYVDMPRWEAFDWEQGDGSYRVPEGRAITVPWETTAPIPRGTVSGLATPIEEPIYAGEEPTTARVTVRVGGVDVMVLPEEAEKIRQDPPLRQVPLETMLSIATHNFEDFYQQLENLQKQNAIPRWTAQARKEAYDEEFARSRNKKKAEEAAQRAEEEMLSKIERVLGGARLPARLEDRIVRRFMEGFKVGGDDPIIRAAVSIALNRALSNIARDAGYQSVEQYVDEMGLSVGVVGPEDVPEKAMRQDASGRRWYKTGFQRMMDEIKIQTNKFGEMNTGQLLQIVQKKIGNIKGLVEEDRWVGFTRWLQENIKQGKKNITKDEVYAWLDEHDVRVEEKVLGNDTEAARYGSIYSLEGGDVYYEIALGSSVKGPEGQEVVPISEGEELDVDHFGDLQEGRGIGHIRMHFRTDLSTGKKQAVITELQSARELKNIQKERARLRRQDKQLTSEEINDEITNLQLEGSLFDRPFTDTHYDVLAKRAVKFAIEHGAHEVVLVPGWVQSSLYDLTIVADEVTIHEHGDTGDSVRLVVKKYGGDLYNAPVMKSELSNYIGDALAADMLEEFENTREERKKLREEYKELKEKLYDPFTKSLYTKEEIDAMWERFRELDKPNIGGVSRTGNRLRIGNIGLESLYDTVLAQIFKKIGKSLGAEVKLTPIARKEDVRIPNRRGLPLAGPGFEITYEVQKQASEPFLILPQKSKSRKEKVRGFFQDTLKGARLIMAVKNMADISTLFHEMAHFVENTMSKNGKYYKALRDWFKKDPASFSVRDKEYFARMLEAYLFTGKAPTADLQDAFDILSLALRDVYKTIEQIDPNGLGEGAKQFMDLMFGKVDSIVAERELEEVNRGAGLTEEELNLSDIDEGLGEILTQMGIYEPLQEILKKETITWEDTKKLAEKLAKNKRWTKRIEKELRSGKRKALTAAEFGAIVLLYARQMHAAYKMSQKLKTDPNAPAKMRAMYEDLAVLMKDPLSEAGRMLNFAKASIAWKEVFENVALLQEKRGGKLSDKDIDDISVLLDADWADAAKIQQAAKVLEERATGKGLWRMVGRTLFINSVLGPVTLGANMFGNVAQVVLLEPSSILLSGAIESTIAMGRKNFPREHYMQDFLSYYKGMFSDLGRATKRVMDLVRRHTKLSLKDFQNDDSLSDWDREMGVYLVTSLQGHESRVGKTVGKYGSLVTKTMLFTDIWFRMLRKGASDQIYAEHLTRWRDEGTLEQNLENLAEKTARKKGVRMGRKGKALEEYVKNMKKSYLSGVDGPFALIHDASSMHSEDATFQTSPGYLTKKLLEARETPVLSSVLFPYMPFIVSNMNIFKRGIELVPGVGAISSLYLSPEMQYSKAEVAAQQIQAAMLTAYAVSLVAEGLLTGPPPDDEGERELWAAEGKKPWSVNAFGTWVPLYRLGPAGIPLGMAAGFMQGIERVMHKERAVNRRAELSEYVAKTSWYMSRFLADQLPLGAPFETLYGTEFDARRAAVSPLNAMIPYGATMKIMNKSIEVWKNGNLTAKEYPAKFFPDGIVQMFSDTLPLSDLYVPGITDKILGPGEYARINRPRIGSTGEVQKERYSNFGPVVPRLWFVGGSAQKELDEVEMELQSLGAYPAMPNKYIIRNGKRYDLSEKQYAELVLQAGKAGKEKVAREMKMPFWRKLSDEQKTVRVDRIFQKERDKARDAIWRKYRTSLIAEEKALAVN